MRLAVLGQPVVQKERKDAARNRLRILEAARKLLKDRPIQDICMDELAKAAGVGKGTLYRRFEDRASLCHALLNDDAVELQNTALAGFGLPFAPPWLAHVDRLLDALFDFAVDHASLLSEAHSYARGGPARFDHPAHRWQRDTLAAFLERATETGEIEPVDGPLTAELVLSGLDPDLISYHLSRGVTRAHLQAEFRRHWRRGVGAEA